MGFRLTFPDNGIAETESDWLTCSMPGESRSGTRPAWGMLDA